MLQHLHILQYRLILFRMQAADIPAQTAPLRIKSLTDLRALVNRCKEVFITGFAELLLRGLVIKGKNTLAHLPADPEEIIFQTVWKPVALRIVVVDNISDTLRADPGCSGKQLFFRRRLFLIGKGFLFQRFKFCHKAHKNSTGMS